MTHTTTDVHVEPGDRFDTYGLRSNTVGQSVYLIGCDGVTRPLNIHGDLAALLALADSLVAACWTLKTAADNAANGIPVEVMP